MKKLIFLIVFLVLGIAVYSFSVFTSEKKRKENIEKVHEVRVVHFQPHTFYKFFILKQNLKIAKVHEVLDCPIREEISEIPIKNGDFVKQGQLLFQLNKKLIQHKLLSRKTELKVIEETIAENKNLQKIYQQRIELTKQLFAEQRQKSIYEQHLKSKRLLEETLKKLDHLSNQKNATIEQIAKLQDLQKKYSIYSPTQGIIVHHNEVQKFPTRPFFSIYSTELIEISLDKTEAENVFVEQNVILELEPNSWRGIVQKLQPKENSVIVFVKLENIPKEFILNNLDTQNLFTWKFLLTEQFNSFSLSKSTFKLEEEPFVFVVKSGKSYRVNVEISQEDQEFYGLKFDVLDKIYADTPVIINGYDLKDKDAVKIVRQH